ncbi:MAG: helix-turn-helix transcriptional regulator [Myxococcota bacterium]
MKEAVLPEAKAELIDLIKSCGEISVDDGADELGLAKTTIRQHLAKLESMGFVKTRSHRHGRGRPRKMYGLTEKADDFFERRDREFLVGLIEYLRARDQEALICSYIEELADELLDGLDVSHLDLERRIRALELLARRQGFMAKRADDSEHTAILEFRNCPFSQVAQLTDHLCEQELEHIRDIIGKPVERVKYRVNGDQTCAYCIKKDDDS